MRRRSWGEGLPQRCFVFNYEIHRRITSHKQPPFKTIVKKLQIFTETSIKLLALTCSRQWGPPLKVDQNPTSGPKLCHHMMEGVLGKLGPSPLYGQIGPRTFWGLICRFLANWAPVNWAPENWAPGKLARSEAGWKGPKLEVGARGAHSWQILKETFMFMNNKYLRGINKQVDIMTTDGYSFKKWALVQTHNWLTCGWGPCFVMWSRIGSRVTCHIDDTGGHLVPLLLSFFKPLKSEWP